MNKNKFRQTGLVIAMAAAMGGSTGAHAAFDLYDRDGLSFSVDGYFNAFYVNRKDDVSDLRDTRIKMGFLPNTIGFTFRKEMGDLTLGGRSSFWTTINDSLDFATDTAIDVRQFYATVDGSFGQLLIGKDFGLYARANIFEDQILMGFGTPGAPGGVSFGNIGAGYPYPLPSAQITWRAPEMGGLKVAAGLLDPADTASGAKTDENATPRFESEITYSTDLGGVALTGWINGRYQSAEDSASSVTVDSHGVGYGLKAVVADFTLLASGFTSRGDNPVLISNSALPEEDADGYLLQGAWRFGDNRLVLSWGETDGDILDTETESLTLGLFHDINSHFRVVAEFNRFEQTTQSSGVDTADTDTLALGAIVTF